MYRYDYAGYGPIIHFAPGRYVTTVEIHGQPVGAHLVNFTGDCTNAASVVVQSPPGAAAFVVQDMAIGTISCLTVTGEIGIAGR
jgi:hypothetical protein